MVSVSEGDEMVTVCATLSAVEATERNFTITLNTNSDNGEYMTMSTSKETNIAILLNLIVSESLELGCAQVKLLDNKCHFSTTC